VLRGFIARSVQLVEVLLISEQLQLLLDELGLLGFRKLITGVVDLRHLERVSSLAVLGEGQ